MGLVTSFPVTLLPPPANASGVWIFTSGARAGTVRIALQFGQGPDLPANFSLTRKLLRHLGQTTGIGIG